MCYRFGDAITMADASPTDPKEALAMGNISPIAQFHNGTTDSMRKATLQIMEACSTFPNFVISSSCDIPPLSSWKNIDAFFQATEDFYKERTGI